MTANPDSVPPPGTLTRWGCANERPGVLPFVPMPDGYWTPWFQAEAQLAEVRAELSTTRRTVETLRAEEERWHEVAKRVALDYFDANREREALRATVKASRQADDAAMDEMAERMLNGEKLLRQALESVCSLKCPSVWRTADHPEGLPHCDDCKAIRAFLAGEVTGTGEAKDEVQCQDCGTAHVIDWIARTWHRAATPPDPAPEPPTHDDYDCKRDNCIPGCDCACHHAAPEPPSQERAIVAPTTDGDAHEAAAAPEQEPSRHAFVGCDDDGIPCSSGPTRCHATALGASCGKPASDPAHLCKLVGCPHRPGTSGYCSLDHELQDQREPPPIHREAEPVRPGSCSKCGGYGHDDGWCAPTTSSEPPRHWLIHFEDADRPVEVFTDETSARTTFKSYQIAWNCTLFMEAPAPLRSGEEK